jgi:hypothetical protein
LDAALWGQASCPTSSTSYKAARPQAVDTKARGLCLSRSGIPHRHAYISPQEVFYVHFSAHHCDPIHQAQGPGNDIPRCFVVSDRTLSQTAKTLIKAKKRIQDGDIDVNTLCLGAKETPQEKNTA